MTYPGECLHYSMGSPEAPVLCHTLSWPVQGSASRTLRLYVNIGYEPLILDQRADERQAQSDAAIVVFMRAKN
jgi:hypothetical protein